MAVLAGLWVLLLAGLTVWLGTQFSFRVTPPWVVPALTPVLLLGWQLGGELPGLCVGRRVAGATGRALLCALGALVACAINQRYLPMQLFAFHAAVTSYGLGLGLLAVSYAHLRPMRGAALGTEICLG